MATVVHTSHGMIRLNSEWTLCFPWQFDMPFLAACNDCFRFLCGFVCLLFYQNMTQKHIRIQYHQNTLTYDDGTIPGSELNAFK